MSMLDFALGIAGVPDTTARLLDTQLPGFARLAAAMKAIEPVLTTAKPHLDALEPLIIQIWPVLVKAWPDIVAVTPTVEQLIDFVNSREQS